MDQHRFLRQQPAMPEALNRFRRDIGRIAGIAVIARLAVIAVIATIALEIPFRVAPNLLTAYRFRRSRAIPAIRPASFSSVLKIFLCLLSVCSEVFRNARIEKGRSRVEPDDTL